ncbi:hypothetical protein BC831DRAFT_444823, partial [Entophlyctis helioformis]
ANDVLSGESVVLVLMLVATPVTVAGLYYKQISKNCVLPDNGEAPSSQRPDVYRPREGREEDDELPVYTVTPAPLGLRPYASANRVQASAPTYPPPAHTGTDGVPPAYEPPAYETMPRTTTSSSTGSASGTSRVTITVDESVAAATAAAARS